MITSQHPVKGPRLSDHRVEQIVGRLLQVGVLIAAVVVIIGGAMLLATSGHVVADFRTFSGAPSPLRSIGGILRGVLAMDTQSIVQFGLVLLIATPAARVALTLVAFILQRDRLYVALTTVVLAVLLYGMFVARI